MEAFSLPHILIILLIVVILFGGRRIPELMRGLGEGIRNFREGMRGEQPPQGTQPPPANPPVAGNQPSPQEKK